MMTSRSTEIWVGLFIAAGLAALFMLAMKVSNLSSYTSGDGFDVFALYEDASGLKVRSPVTMAGVTIGRVTEIRFEPLWDVTLRDGKLLKQVNKAGADVAKASSESMKRTFVAVVTMRIENGYNNKIPEQSDANIYTAGLLGEKYVGLSPGSTSTACEDDDLAAALEGKPATSSGKNCQARYLTQGSVIKKSQGSIVLEKLIARFIDKFSDSGSKK
jgi:phospholipid/cholesterol/gamma-HCH transport system substrate-binding protein